MGADDDMIRHLNEEWQSATEVHRKVGAWSPMTIRRRLAEMRRTLTIDSRLRPIPQGKGLEVREYRLKPPE